MLIRRDQELMDYLNKNDSSLDAIVVEGYDGVGKGRILNMLSAYYKVTPYRPDYNMWNKHDLRKIDRWKISGFFWDIYSHFNIHDHQIMLFDRGMLSGAVYNHDMSIAGDYKQIIGHANILNILVTCNKRDYQKFADLRGVNCSEDDWNTYEEFTNLYLEVLESSGADYIIYENSYQPAYADLTRNTCEGCGHYSYGICRHPSNNYQVDKDDVRCDLYRDQEIQDEVSV